MEHLISIYLIFHVLVVFNFNWCLSRLQLSRCWLGRVDANTAWCTSEENFIRKIKENTAVAIYHRITFPVLEIRHLIRSLYINASVPHSRRFTPIIHLTRYFALQNKKNISHK